MLVGILAAIPLVLESGAPPSPGSAPAIYVNATLSVGSSLGSHLASPFYGVVWNLAGESTPTLQAKARFFNSTPITLFRIGGEGDGYDPTTQTDYVAPSSGTGPYVAVHALAVNYTWFESWCRSRSPDVRLAGLPSRAGEQHPGRRPRGRVVPRRPRFRPDRVAVRKRTRQVDPLRGEPHAVRDLGQLDPDGDAYTTVVADYRAAVAALYPSDRFIGIEASCDCDGALLPTTAAVVGGPLRRWPTIAYPGPPVDRAAPSTSSTEASTSNMDLVSTSGHLRDNVVAGCPGCSNLPVQVGEYQPALRYHSPFALEYPGAPWLAASVIEGLEANVSTLTVFNSHWLTDQTTGAILPEGLLYQRILSNMTMGTDHAVTLSTPSIGGIYAIAIHNGSRQSLLLVDTNTTVGLNLTIPSSAFPIGPRVDLELGSEFRVPAHARDRGPPGAMTRSPRRGSC